MAICKNCGNEFEGKRSDAKYCSDVCRVIFNRNIEVKPVTATVTANMPKNYKTAEELAPGEYNRVSKPGDTDYVPQCETTRAFVEGRPKRPETDKRGKDIKVFEDLPLDVQRTIDKMSMVDGKIDQTTKANRTAIAIHYQHLFPARYHSTGAV